MAVWEQFKKEEEEVEEAEERLQLRLLHFVTGRINSLKLAPKRVSLIPPYHHKLASAQLEILKAKRCEPRTDLFRSRAKSAQALTRHD